MHDSQIATALRCSRVTVERIRKQFVLAGQDATVLRNSDHQRRIERKAGQARRAIAAARSKVDEAAAIADAWLAELDDEPDDGIL